MSQPEVAILVSTFERPRHLGRVLASIAAQNGMHGALEVVVTDDGSSDETPQLVREFSRSVSFPVQFTTHRHQGFHISRCRNEGVAASTAPYLLFLDGDCLIPPDHVRTHLARRTDGQAVAGYPIYFSEAVTSRITPAEIAGGGFLKHVTWKDRLSMRWRHVRGLMGRLTGDPQRPKLLGGNLGISRADYLRVNGYDENYRGWGCEDDDIRLRLHAAGIRIRSIAWWTNTYHLWHPKTPTAPATWREGGNIAYFRRPARPTRCLMGVKKRRLQDLHIALAGRRPPEALLRQLPFWCRVASGSQNRADRSPPEIEIVIGDMNAAFSAKAEVKVLVVAAGQNPSPALLAQAHLVFAPQPLGKIAAERQFAIDEFDRVLQWQLGAFVPALKKMANAA